MTKEFTSGGKTLQEWKDRKDWFIKEEPNSLIIYKAIHHELIEIDDHIKSILFQINEN